MTIQSPSHSSTAADPSLPRHWGWLLALGLVMVVLGTVGIGMSVFLTLATVFAFGALMLAGGVLQAIHGLTAKEQQWRGRALHLFIALLYVATGALIFYDPLAASAGLTLLLAASFLAMGASRLAGAMRDFRSGEGWVASAIVGLVDIVLAAIVLAQWPVSGLWVIGLMVAIEMIMNGWLLVLVALAARRRQRENITSS